MNNIQEQELTVFNGWAAILCVLFIGLLLFLLKIDPMIYPFYVVLSVIFLKGLFILQPNQAVLANFFGKYVGSVKEQGFYWNNPFNGLTKVSIKLQNYITPQIKVNDRSGNPIEISIAVTWKVQDTAQAIYGIENYPSFLSMQSESALRKVVSTYKYDSDENDSHDDEFIHTLNAKMEESNIAKVNRSQITLKNNSEEVAKNLKETIQKAVAVAGIAILDARITYIAYAPEIAQAMLRKQQAEAIVAARQKIVDGALGIVENVIDKINDEELVTLDNEHKVELLINLMTVLVSEKETTPTISVQSKSISKH
jgi:regulator of protease activity HflC (stomatin/prohibitin superfamily)